jgi:hypothetical protein
MAGRMVLPKLAVVVQVQGRDSASVLPTILYRAARPGTIPHSRPLWTPAGQGERRPGEASRTLLDELHPAENRKVGGSIPSLPTTTVQVSACGTGPPVGGNPPDYRLGGPLVVVRPSEAGCCRKQ